MRGALGRYGVRRDRLGIIPAYAGSTMMAVSGTYSAKDHPRVCGEHSKAVSRMIDAMGSSPRMRGARPAPPERARRRRIIPAYAGSTCSRLTTRLFAWDHPRVCGEHTHPANGRERGAGSSPRMRGAPPYLGRDAGRGGIIPAYAGSTLRRGPFRFARGDHPRVCGEHPPRDWSRFKASGSSPRMRGALIKVLILLLHMGIIPAYAGSTKAAAARRAAAEDHPRVCGEHGNRTFQQSFDKGSSPRMRGAPVADAAGLHEFGIIPAYAGSTRAGGFTMVATGDHPRVCGEHDHAAP